MSDWGQGVNNNSIGWGQGYINNVINWGKIYLFSWAGDTAIMGVVSQITNDFKTRVLADGGVFEAQSCLNTTLTHLNTI